MSLNQLLNPINIIDIGKAPVVPAYHIKTQYKHHKQQYWNKHKVIKEIVEKHLEWKTTQGS